MARSILLLLSLNVASIALAESPKTEREWPFYPIRAPKPPIVKNKEWVRNEVDAFVLQRLEKEGLAPAQPATRQQLIRRLYFDLIGLPPAPEDVETFLNDKSQDAYERVVDRLLKDPRYGEQWARFWLDLARYADTAGYEGDPDLPYVWRYRNYVIDAFNNDKPYDLFIKEQIAGDEFAEVMGAGDLPSTPAERVVALTFLRLAPFTEPRGDETRHELLSEMTSTVGSVFLGLTVGCAKCHDHKYDNIPTKDFYRMKAFFATVSIPRPEPGDGFQIGGPLPATFYRKGESQWAANERARYEREIADSKQELAQLKEKLSKSLCGGAGFGLQAMGGPLGNNYIYGRTSVTDGKLHVSIVNCDAKKWRYFTDGIGPDKTGSNAGGNRGQWFGDLPSPKHVALGQYSEGLGRIKKARAHHIGEFAQLLIYDHPVNEAERNEIQSWVNSTSAAPPKDGLSFWLDSTDIDADPNTKNPLTGTKIAEWIDRITGTTLSQNDPELQPIVTGKGLSFDNKFLVGALKDAKFVKNQSGALVVVYSARHAHEGYGFEVGGNGSFISTFINPGAASRENIDAILTDADSKLISEADRKRFRWLSTRERFLRQNIKRLQPVAMSLRHSYGPPYEPGVPVSRVMIRGEYDNPGEEVEAGFLSSVTGNDSPAKIRLDPFKRWPTRSRRMALAQWIASADNPLTARVMVNRLWYRHFGQGIVKTPSDFGKLSGGPSHPKLLDWLAAKFIKSKWSIKAIHREIVTSATYRQSSLRTDANAEKVDPDNTLLWRFRRRRLEAEAIRDSVLSVSGRLNPDKYGLPIFPPLPDDIEERVKYSNTKWDTQDGPEGRKRSLYIYQQRTLTMPFMQSFDALVCDESRPRRRHSVTPLQALAMYNGQFVSEEANHFADRVRKEVTQDVNKQIEQAFQIALCRNPSKEELQHLRELIASDSSQLVRVCRVLLNSNEFVYID